MAEQPIDKNQIIKDGAIEDVIKKFKDWEDQLKKNNQALLEVAKNTEIKPVINTEDFAKLITKVEKLEALYKKQSENTKQLTTIERERLKLIKATETAEAKKIIAINKENKALIELQQETNKANKAQRDAIKVSERQKNAYSKLSDETTKYKIESKRLGAELLKLEADGKSLSKEWINLSKAYDKATLSAKKGDAQLKKLDKVVGDNQRKVGLYENATRRLSSALGALGIAFGIGQIKSFIGDLIEINVQSKGVQFAFDRLGVRGVDAFERIKKSTRGLLSDLEIKKSINEFKNFNLSLEQSDVLFEFLSVRATQTGKSVDSLRDSLVEGLSKESKLRIDNLGISTKDLNNELERTPSFIDAVANIAKRELVKAGDILDEAGSSQGRWNAQIANTKELLAKELQPAFESTFSVGANVLKFIADNLGTILKLVSLTVKGFILYKSVTISLTLAQKAYVAIQTLAIKGTKAFNSVTKANVIGALVTVLVLAYEALSNYTAQLSIAETVQKSLNNINKIALSNTVKQKSELESLLIVANNKNLSDEQRINAIKRLNEISPEYLGNLTLETIGTKEATKAVDAYIASLDKISIAKARQSRIDKINAELQIEELKRGKDFLEDLTTIQELGVKGARVLGIGTEDAEKTLLRIGVQASVDRVARLRAEKLAIQALQREGLEAETAISKESVENESSSSKAKVKIVKDEYDQKKKLRESDGKDAADFLKKQLEEEIQARKDATFSTENDLPTFGEEGPESDPFFSDESISKREAEAQKTKDTYNSVLNSVTETYQTLNSMVSDSIDTAIEGQNRLISNSERTIDMIKQSAIAGNEQAKESILAEEKAIEESQKRIEKAQKRKQRLELISSGLNSFNSKVAGGMGGGQALIQTGAEMAGLIGLLSALPSFFVGADRLGRDGSPIDSQGGFLAINHPDERIVPSAKNKMIGFDTSNEQLANVMNHYNKGLLVPVGQIGVVQAQNDNSDILKSIESGFSKINNYNMSVTELFGQITVMIEKSKNGDKFISKKTFRP